jgi:hypothetical protein
MDELTRLRTSRVGVLLLLFATVLAVVVLTFGMVEVLLVSVPLAAVGVGLVRCMHVARILAGVVFAVVVVGSPLLLISDFVDVGAHLFATEIIDATAATTLAVWLGVRALLVLRGKPSGNGLITARVVGGALLAIAVVHLSWWQRDMTAGVSLWISTDNVEIFGFTAWPIWHGALAVTALALLFAPRVIVAHVAAALVALLAALVALVIVSPTRDRMIDVIALAIALPPAYLAWWLRAELRLTAA